MARTGDTLRSVARAVWGDDAMCYLIAEANGMSVDTALTQNQVLVIPNKVTNIHNNAQTFRPYNPGETIGRVDPTLPPVPQPPQQDDGCGVVGQIVMVAIAAAVVYMTAAAATGAVASLFGTTGAAAGSFASVATYAGGYALAGAAGSIVSQGVGMVMGMQNSINWRAVGQAALSSAIGGGLSASGVVPADLSNFTRGAAIGAMSSGINMALHGTWSWSQLAGSAIGGAIGSEFGASTDPAVLPDPLSGMQDLAGRFVGNWVGSRISTGRAQAASAWVQTLGDALSRAAVTALDLKPWSVQQGARMGQAAREMLGLPPTSAQVAMPVVGNALGSSLVNATQPEPVAGSGLKLGSAGNAGLRLSGSAVDSWSRQVDEGIASSAAAMRGDWTTGDIVVADGATVYDDGSSPGVIGALDGALLAANGARLRNPSSGQRLTMVPRELQVLRDPTVLADPAKLRSLYNVALDNSRAWLPASLSPEETSLTTGVAYQKVFGEDRTAIWFGLAPYATSKVGETYQQLDKFGLLDHADAKIIRSGFREGNRAIFESMFTAEQFYQAGGTDAIRAMVNLDSKSFGASWTPRNLDYSNSLVESFELRDQAKAAFAAGQTTNGEMLLGQSLRASADFEQRVVLQQYYDKSYTASTLLGNSETKTLRLAIQDAFKIPESAGARSAWDRPGWNLGIETYAERASMVTINGQSLSFAGRDMGDVNQRMPFVYSLADNLMKTYSSAGDWLSGSQRIYQDQFNVLQKTYGADAVFSVRRRMGF